MEYISFRRLTISDAEQISKVLLSSDESYTKYFHPFDFQTSSIKNVIAKSIKDCFFAVEINTGNESKNIGFYMLRGIDQGYTDPMYGVFISHQYSGKGIARLTISHAESFCKLNGFKKLLLKVHPENFRAKNLYESLGFQFLREDASNKNIVLYKNI